MKNTPRSRLKLLFPLLLAIACSLVAGLAQADPSAQVGRIAYLEGSATLYPERNAAGQPARLNWPVVEGAVVETGRRSRAEIWVGSTTLRLGDDSRLEFATLDDNRVSLRLTSGMLAITLRDPEQARELELATPNAWARFDNNGQYRIDVGPQRSNFATLGGRTLILRDGEQTSVPAGQTASVDGRGVDLYGLPMRDDFDDWIAARESLNTADRSRYYVSPRMTGYQELDRHGDWASTPDYGSLWFPRDVPYGWAPYQQGQWVWVSPWGWTWVDDSPWGFAPFHYGRWLEIGGRWAWSPGAYVTRPVYAPALVTWLGRPEGRSNHGPGARWAPLAPSQNYIPPYRASVGHVEQLNHGWGERRESGRNWREEARPQTMPPVRRETVVPAGESPVRIYQRQESVPAPSERPSWREQRVPSGNAVIQPAAPTPVVPSNPAPSRNEMRNEGRNEMRNETRWPRQENNPTPVTPPPSQEEHRHERFRSERQEAPAAAFRPAEAVVRPAPAPAINSQPLAPAAAPGERHSGQHEHGGERGDRRERGQ